MKLSINSKNAFIISISVLAWLAFSGRQIISQEEDAGPREELQATQEVPEAAGGVPEVREPSTAEQVAVSEEVPGKPAEMPVVETLLGVEILPAPAVEREADKQQPGEKKIRLNFRDASLDSVLEYLSETAGLSVVRETTVEGRITVMSRQPISVNEAVSLLNVALKEKGYAAISMGRILKIVPLADAKKRNIPVRSGNNPADIEPTDMIVTQIIPIRYLNVTQLKQDLAPLLPAYAELTANVSSNSLILTDTEANIRRIAEIVRALDTAVSAVAEVKVFQLKYANATTTARLINEMFKVEQTTARTGQQGAIAQAAARFFGRTGQPAGTAAATEGGQPNVKVNASADDRTNTLVVSGPPDVLKVIEGVVQELDSSPAEEQAVFIYSLKNATAKSLETVLNNLFGTSTTGTARRTTSTVQRFQQTGSNVSASSAQAASSLYGQVYIVADSDTNSLMVMTASKNFERVKEIIADLDRPVPQVLIKVLIAEVTHDRALDLGTEFSLMNLTSNGSRKIFSKFGVAEQSTGLGISLVEDDLSVAIAALQKVGKLDVLSRPYILGSDNQAAKITVGQRVPFITNSRMTDTGQTINTIQYQDIGIILTVTPHINPAGLVILDVTPEISALTGTTVPISENVDAPVFAKRSATSRVAIQDGQTIVIGGLMEDRKTEDIKKVPFLGDIPLLGALFRRNNTESSKTELLIFLTPHVAPYPEMLSDISEEELEGTVILPNAIKSGEFKKYMDMMERKGNGVNK
ncbi:MAG TPA: type II secretion system secretin GspD [bacterium]|nr:type II secretion system secretin GspD [bacterium]